MNLDLFKVSCEMPVKNAMAAIDRNQFGAVFATDSLGRVIGVITDGDIRRFLIAGNSIDAPIKMCIKPHFVHASTRDSREAVLKKLDTKIRFVPILNDQQQLVDIVTPLHYPLATEHPVFARARAPVRVSFGGGGSDLTHFFRQSEGAVINSTIAVYSHAVLRKRQDKKVKIVSSDIDVSLEAACLKDLIHNEGELDLILAALKLINPDFGFELYLRSDFPVGSGLGGSAALCAAILGCFNEYRQDKWDQHDIAELAYQAERLYSGVSGGWQDQYASAFGGFNFIEFKLEQNVIHPLRIKPETLLELESNLVLCNTGIQRNSGNVHNTQRVSMQNGNVQDRVRQNVELTYQMRNYLLRGNLNAFACCLDKAWQLKRGFDAAISNNTIDNMYETAKQNGALGGKLLGAGGGGFMLFYVPAFSRRNVVTALTQLGKQVTSIIFEPEGVQSWTVRETEEILNDYQ